MAADDRLRGARARIARHLWFVRWMKVALPLAVLILIAAIFLAGLHGGSGGGIDPATTARLAAMGTGMELDNPRFSGTTDAGAPFAVTADRALPDEPVPNRIELENPVGKLQMDERSVTAEAETGALFRDEKRLRLNGDVVVETSDGYQLRTGHVRVDLATRTAVAPDRVRIVGPDGNIEADRMRVIRGAGKDETTIRFEGDVRVHWQPVSGGEAGGGKDGG